MKLSGPADVFAHFGVRNEATYLSAHLRFISGRGLDPRPQGTRPVAYVSESRWCADCPECNAGISVAPDWRACCFGCGAVYPGAVFPDDWESIEADLVKLPLPERDWRPARAL